ncbi:hypothetical protein LCGC14_1994170, partial [marine sediment metagenome]
MKIKRKEIILLIFLILLIFTINYSYIDEKLEDFLLDYEIVVVERVIDGDTFVSGNNWTCTLASSDNLTNYFTPQAIYV